MFPLLKTGVIFEIFQSFGTVPVDKDRLNRLQKDEEIEKMVCLSIEEEIAMHDVKTAGPVIWSHAKKLPNMEVSGSAQRRNLCLDIPTLAIGVERSFPL